MKRILCLFTALLLFMCPMAARALSEQESFSRERTFEASLPLSEYPPGSFFTKNGSACDCHGNSDCVSSGSDCNCMRYYPTGNPKTCEIDLLGVQCIGFARLCQYRLFGRIDRGATADTYTNILGSVLYAGTWSVSDAKYYISRAPIGGHIRIATHSLVIMSLSESGFVTYECNSNSAGRECMVFTRGWTWESFFAYYGSSNWRYLNVPNELVIPDNTESAVTTPDETTAVSTPDETTAPVTAVDVTEPVETTAENPPDGTAEPTTDGSIIYPLFSHRPPGYVLSSSRLTRIFSARETENQ